MSAAVLAIHEDKSASGAMIASLSIPWGDSKGDHELGGYHLVWPRDLVNSAGALLALGHDVMARRTLRYLLSTQEADGRWAQNLWLDGTPYWNGVQMDEIAFPIFFAELLRREGQLEDLDPWPMIRGAAGFLRAPRPGHGAGPLGGERRLLAVQPRRADLGAAHRGGLRRPGARSRAWRSCCAPRPTRGTRRSSGGRT